jgi:hypothetical protein
MPRNEQILSVEQINEILDRIDGASDETFAALRRFLQADLKRRTSAGQKGGRPKSPVDAKTRNREAVRKFRAKKKKG